MKEYIVIYYSKDTKRDIAKTFTSKTKTNKFIVELQQNNYKFKVYEAIEI